MQPFVPHALPITGLDWENLMLSIGKANAAVSLYNGLLRSIPNPHILLSPITSQEAVLSSRIEGTQATLCDVFKFEAGEDQTGERKHDIFEIINYRRALFRAEKLLQKIPAIHLNMLKELHALLMTGVRGKNKAPGEFRTVQNFIGRYGATIEQATYVPPSPEKVLPALDEWEKYINREDQEICVQLAVMHAQFEIIHPFLDGNGRLGRMLIPIFLHQKNMLTQPVLYLSEYFEKRRDLYYQMLRGITEKGDWQSWILFFLDALIEQARTNTEKTESILRLYEKTKEQVMSLTNSSQAIHLLEAFFAKPIINTSELQRETRVQKKTILLILKRLESADIIKMLKKGRGRMPGMCAFPELINLTEGREVYLGE
jgi:Fic family protein